MPATAEGIGRITQESPLTISPFGAQPHFTQLNTRPVGSIVPFAGDGSSLSITTKI